MNDKNIDPHEWTLEQVEDLLKGSPEVILDAINATTHGLRLRINGLEQQRAAEREKREMAILQYQSVIRQLRSQLAAATARELHSYDVAKLCREQLAAAVAALEAILEENSPANYHKAQAALAKIKEGK